MSHTWGGARRGAGRPRQNLHISLEHAKMLAEITRRWREQLLDLDENRMVELLITQQAVVEAESERERSGQG